LRVWHPIVPLCNNDQGSCIDLRRIVIWLPRISVITVVLKYAVWTAQHRGILL
jgi:hypothetical protein